MPENIGNLCICISYILTTYEVHTIILLLPVRSQGVREQIQIAQGVTVIQTCNQNYLTSKATFFMIELFNSPNPVAFLPYFLEGKFKSLCERKVQVIEGTSRFSMIWPQTAFPALFPTLNYRINGFYISTILLILPNSSYDMDFTTMSLCLCQ